MARIITRMPYSIYPNGHLITPSLRYLLSTELLTKSVRVKLAKHSTIKYLRSTRTIRDTRSVLLRFRHVIPF